MSARPVPNHRLWFLVLGFGAWCSALITVYGLHSIGCTFFWSADTIRLSLGLAILAHLVLIGWLWRNYAKAPADPAFGPTGSGLTKETLSAWVVEFQSLPLSARR